MTYGNLFGADDAALASEECALTHTQTCSGEGRKPDAWMYLGTSSERYLALIAEDDLVLIGLPWIYLDDAYRYHAWGDRVVDRNLADLAYLDIPRYQDRHTDGILQRQSLEVEPKGLRPVDGEEMPLDSAKPKLSLSIDAVAG